jgi:hypothetical protein
VHLAPQVLEAAKRIYLLAHQSAFLPGRKSPLVCACCLYVACRQSNLDHMLVDFADYLKEDVFRLGSVYVKLLRFVLLKQCNVEEAEEMARRKSPLADPALYMQRFVARLQLGSAELTQSVAQLATRVVSRMGRDWLVTGRKPAGVCGAALVVATRLLGCRREVWEVVQVVRVCQETVRRRMKEFLKTPSAELSLEEFNRFDLMEEREPPALTAAVTEEMESEARSALEVVEGALLQSEGASVVGVAPSCDVERAVEERDEELSELAPEELRELIWPAAVVKCREERWNKLFPQWDKEHAQRERKMKKQEEKEKRPEAEMRKRKKKKRTAKRKRTDREIADEIVRSQPGVDVDVLRQLFK